jgi:type IV pilus assembly protein PilV
MRSTVKVNYIKHQQGSMLLEALIAVLIFSLGILALVGLQGTMIKNTGSSKYRADASYIAEQRIGAMWADPANLASYVDASAVSISDLPNGMRQVTSLGSGSYKVTIGWTAPGETTNATTTATCGMSVAHCFSTIATIVGG